MMKKFLSVCLVLGLLLSLLPAALAASTGPMYIRTLQSYNSRVKLRAAPTTSAEIIGQYYAGTTVYVLDYNAIYQGEFKDEWARVTIGGRTGYMMNEYLVSYSDESTPGEVFPLHGEEAVLMNEKGETIDTVSGGEIQVLGTTGYDTVHAAVVREDGLIEYGYLYADEVLWTGEHQKARVRAIQSRDSVPVYKEPNAAGGTICSLYPGTEVQILFSNDVATSGWTRVRIDNVTGYMPDPYLDHSSGDFPFYRPQPAELKIPVAPVYGGKMKTVTREDILFVLGKRTVPAEEYLVLFGAWDEDGSLYKLYTGFVPMSFITLKKPGGVSARGMLRKSSYIYQISSAGEMIPVTDRQGSPILYPMGTEFQIAYGLDAALQEEGGLLTGYLTQDTVWVFVELRVPEEYKGIQGYLPLKVIRFDQRLMLPGNKTGG